MGLPAGYLPSLEYILIEKCDEMVSVFPTTLRYLTISDFKNIKGLNGKGFHHLTSFQQLSLSDCYQLQCLQEEGLPQTLTSFNIVGCTLLRPRCQRGTGKHWPKIQHIPQIYIDWIEI